MIETGSAFISLYNDRIMEVKVRKNMHIELPEAAENDAVVAQLNPTGERALLLQIQGIFTISPEVLEKGASEASSKLFCAMAILIDKSSPGLIGQFYIKVNKPSRPTRMFTDRAEAIAWLEEQYLLNKKRA